MDIVTFLTINDCASECMEICRDDPTQEWIGWLFIRGQYCQCFKGVLALFFGDGGFILDFFDEDDRAAALNM